MALDFEKVRGLSLLELLSLALCEFSRFTDAIERIAPDVVDPTAPPVEPEPVVCPHPTELRLNLATMGQEPFSTFRCGVCGEQVTPCPV